jgi:hypothetical protein
MARIVMIVLLSRLLSRLRVDDSTFGGLWEAMAKPGLDDPDYARFAWSRFRKLMIWMVLASSATAVGGLWVLKSMIGPVPMHMAIATGVGTFVSVMLAGGLMSLVFLSNGSGHDDSIHDPFEEPKP